MIYSQLIVVMKKAERRLTRIYHLADERKKILVFALDYEHGKKYAPNLVDTVDEALAAMRHILKQPRFVGTQVQMRIDGNWLAVVEIHRPSKDEKGYNYIHSGWFKVVLEEGFYDRSGDTDV